MNTIKQVGATELRTIIEGLNGASFLTQFEKRTTGETRTMFATTEIAPYLKGGSATYNAFEKSLAVVADLEVVQNNLIEGTAISPIRSIPLDSVRWLVSGETLWIIRK